MSGMVMMLPSVVMNVISVISAGFPAVFQAEHGAEAGYRHRNHHGVDIIHHVAHAAYLEEEVEAQRNHHQAEHRSHVNLRTADNLLEGQLRHTASDNHQGGRNRYVAHHRYRTGDDIRRMNPQRHQQGCHGSRNQSRTQQIPSG